MLTLRPVDALAAIAEPRRREILRMVSLAELSAGEIARRFDVTRPAISQHLRVLKEANLVSERKSGTKRLYRERPETISELRAYINVLWDARLRTLKAAEAHEEKKMSRIGRRHELIRHKVRR